MITTTVTNFMGCKSTEACFGQSLIGTLSLTETQFKA